MMSSVATQSTPSQRYCGLNPGLRHTSHKFEVLGSAAEISQQTFAISVSGIYYLYISMYLYTLLSPNYMVLNISIRRARCKPLHPPNINVSTCRTANAGKRADEVNLKTITSYTLRNKFVVLTKCSVIVYLAHT